MAEEKAIRSIDDFLQYIYRNMQNQKIGIRKTEEDLGFSQGLISRWKKTKGGPNFTFFMDLCDYLNIEVVLRENSIVENPVQVNVDETTVEDHSKLAVEETETTSQKDSKSTINEDILSCVNCILSSDDIDLANKKLILDILTSTILLARH